jgi:small multidrug resistance pump
MNPMFVTLFLAIVSEVVATSALKLSEGFTRPGPSVLVVVGYVSAFYLLSQSLRAGMPLGVAYAVWSGLGTVGIVAIGVVLFREQLTAARVVGTILVVAGVVILNLRGTSNRAASVGAAPAPEASPAPR